MGLNCDYTEINWCLSSIKYNTQKDQVALYIRLLTSVQISLDNLSEERKGLWVWGFLGILR